MLSVTADSVEMLGYSVLTLNFTPVFMLSDVSTNLNTVVFRLNLGKIFFCVLLLLKVLLRAPVLSPPGIQSKLQKTHAKGGTDICLFTANNRGVYILFIAAFDHHPC